MCIRDRLTTFSIPHDVLETLESEEDLEQVINSKQTTQNTDTGITESIDSRNVTKSSSV